MTLSARARGAWAAQRGRAPWRSCNDGKLEMGRHLDRKIAGPRALEEAGEIASERTGEGRDGAIDLARQSVR